MSTNQDTSSWSNPCWLATRVAVAERPDILAIGILAVEVKKMQTKKLLETSNFVTIFRIAKHNFIAFC